MDQHLTHAAAPMLALCPHCWLKRWKGGLSRTLFPVHTSCINVLVLLLGYTPLGVRIVVVLYFHCGRAVLPLWSCCTSIVVVLYFHCGRAVLPLWSCCTSIVVVLYFHCGRAVLPLWSCCTSIVVVLYFHCGRAVLPIVVVLYFPLWSCCTECLW